MKFEGMNRTPIVFDARKNMLVHLPQGLLPQGLLPQG
jgi:hypothetical protein